MDDVFISMKTVDDLSVLTGHAFEEYLAQLFTALGYSVARTPGSGDFGADVIMSRGGRTIAVQAKHYVSDVGFDAVKEVGFAREFYGTDEAWVICTSRFTRQAVRAAEKTGVRLMGRDGLQQLMTLYHTGSVAIDTGSSHVSSQDGSIELEGYQVTTVYDNYEEVVSDAEAGGLATPGEASELVIEEVEATAESLCSDEFEAILWYLNTVRGLCAACIGVFSTEGPDADNDDFIGIKKSMYGMPLTAKSGIKYRRRIAINSSNARCSKARELETSYACFSGAEQALLYFISLYRSDSRTVGTDYSFRADGRVHVRTLALEDEMVWWYRKASHLVTEIEATGFAERSPVDRAGIAEVAGRALSQFIGCVGDVTERKEENGYDAFVAKADREYERCIASAGSALTKWGRARQVERADRVLDTLRASFEKVFSADA